MPRKTDRQKRVSTAVLLSRIFNTKSIENYIARNREHMTLPTLAGHLEELCRKKGVKPSEAVKNADIDRFYGSKIFSGKRANPHRDYLIRLAIGLTLDYKECQRLLDVARESRLYPRVPRDAVIISCLRDKLTYMQTEERLYENGMTVLGEEHEKNPS